MDKEISGLKLIYLTGRVDQPDDPSLPYKLEVNLRPPELLNVSFVFMHGGSQELIVRSETRAALDEFIQLNDYENHPRLRTLTITGPNGVELEIPKVAE